MNYVEDLRKIIGHRPIILVGSVVVLMNDKGEILLQQRKYPIGKWGLPGGLMELGESTEDTAKREVYEETGLFVHELKLINVYSGADQFIKAPNNDEFYSVTVAYHSDNYSGDMLLNKKEGMDLKFFKPSELPEYLVTSHQKIIREHLNNLVVG